MAERLAGQGVAVVVYNRTPERATALAGRIGAGVAATPADAASRSRRRHLDGRRRRGRRTTCTAARMGSPPVLRAGFVAVDMSTVLPDTIRVDRAGRPRAAAPASSTRRSRAASRPPSRATSRSWSAATRPTSSALVRSSTALAKRVFHLGALGTGAAMKLAVNTVVFGLNEALAEAPRPGRAERHRPGARLRRPGRERRRGAVRRLQAGRLPRRRTTRPSPSRWPWPPRTSASSPTSPRRRAARCPRRPSISPRSGRPRSRSGSRPTSRWSRATCVRRAGDDRSAMRRAQRSRSTPRTEPIRPHRTRGNDR